MSRPGTTGDDWRREHPELFARVQGSSSHASLAQPTKPRKRATTITLENLKLPELNGDVLTLWLPLPPEELHPNARVHFQNKARHAKSARNIAATVATLARLPKPWEAARIDATFYLARVRDADGLWTWIKNYIDGLQGLVIQNDSRVTLGDVQQVTGKKHTGGDYRVELTVTRIEP